MKSLFKYILLLIFAAALGLLAAPETGNLRSYVHKEFSGTVTSFQDTEYGLVISLLDESGGSTRNILIKNTTGYWDEAAESIIEDQQTGETIIADCEYWDDTAPDYLYPAVGLSTYKEE